MIRLGYKLLLAQFCLLLVTVAGVLVWMQPDLVEGHLGAAFFKMLTLGTVSLALTAAVCQHKLHSWAQQLQALKNFVAAMPETQADLPDDGPPEIRQLAEMLRVAGKDVRRIMDRTNLESSRREAILTCMAEGVLAVDADLKVIFCNDAFAQSFGLAASHGDGRTLFEFVREPALRDMLRNTLETGSPESDRLRLATAGSRTFEARARPLGNQLRHGAVVVLHDITDVEHQEQVRKDFVADVSHELRTPLSAIRGFAETLLDGALEDAENSRKFVEIILSHAIRLGNIASDLLVLSDLDSNRKPEPDLQRLPVHDIIESALHTVENSAALKNVKLQFADGEACYVMGMRFRLEQALVNLLDNAVKFNREGGEVRVTCSHDDSTVQISVTDTGIGIPSGELKRVFERFYRVDKARSRPVGGTGLGLPIVKEVVERMGGSVQVESVLGKGSKFTLNLKSA